MSWLFVLVALIAGGFVAFLAFMVFMLALGNPYDWRDQSPASTESDDA